ncbi:mitochondrial splicing system protein [Malassezia nana]|uniref:Mitochondrial splicing system protein n=1 Tax=Malassezia nana TaxID=180528 RepID=A0AAF0EL83_9BASI|nr:mitochondrial splicing system protein [Malassezia nana]
MTTRREWVPRQLVRRRLRHPCTREVLDDALLAYFPPGQSFSGDATLELHLHGGPAVVRDVLAALSDARALFDTPLRPAAPGEFTRRAFEHGRMDLTACEALDALLHAETSSQRRLAQQAGDGRQARLYDTLRTQLLHSMASIEAMLDFAEEDDVDTHLWESAQAQVREMRAYLAKQLQLGVPTAQRSFTDAAMQGLRVALYGQPNVGKSSLLNQLARRDAAIVSAHPGTTRDIVEASIEVAGFRVTLADTAGLRETHDEVEQLGMQRTRSYVAAADLAVLVCTPDDWATLPPAGPTWITAQEAAQLGVRRAQGAWDALPDLILINKMDTARQEPRPRPATLGHACYVWHASVAHEQGIDRILEDLGAWVTQRFATEARETPLVTQARHRHLLLDVVACLDTFLAVPSGTEMVVAAEALRRAAQLLGEVTGHTLSSHDVLGDIFARFCIGK